jgi:hypothetical protein
VGEEVKATKKRKGSIEENEKKGIEEGDDEK